MILKRMYDEKLAQTSYLVGCAGSGEAVVIDPSRDPEPYLQAAAAEGMRLVAVTETHIHADFLSGSRELAKLAGATLYLSDEGTPDWKYGFAGEPNVKLLREGDSLRVGAVRLDVLHTPGHTPEHLSFLLVDEPASPEPMGLFSGDFLFVGDVGRPDLLETAAGVTGSREPAARALFRSLRRLEGLPDHLQVWPGHGAGSACGKSLGGVPQSTLGYERLANPALALQDEEEFVRFILEGQPEPPRYFARMKRQNKEGPAPLGGIRLAPAMGPARIDDLLEGRALVVDLRRADAFARGHLPGSLNIPLDRSFPNWAGALLPDDQDLYLVVEDPCERCAEAAARDLARVGLDRVAGYLPGSALRTWAGSGRTLATVTTEGPEQVRPLVEAGAVNVVDVRGRSEWQGGHLPGASHIPLVELPERLQEVPTDRPLVLQCGSGARSAIAASLVQRHGIGEVRNLAGGFAAWKAAGGPVVQDGSR